MATPRSPTHAFDPTPALERDPRNFSPLNIRGGPDSFQASIGKSARGVHFSDHPTVPIHGRHSIATTDVPLLPPISSASQIPKHTFAISNAPPGVNINEYIERAQDINNHLRAIMESERKQWEIERSALKARISELEQRLNKNKDPKRRSSNDSSLASVTNFRSDFSHFPKTNGISREKKSSPTDLSTAPLHPIWIGPEATPPVTRVFSNDDSDGNTLPSISEDAPLETILTKDGSPVPNGPEKEEVVPVPVEQVDKTLDGITLKSTGLTSSFVKITSPKFQSPAQTPSPRPAAPPETVRTAEPLRLDSSSLLLPFDEKLKMHAGHTPMAIFDGTLSTGATSTNSIVTPKQDDPPEPAPTKRPPLRPTENSESYFSFTAEASKPADTMLDQPIPEEMEHEPVQEPEDDPALKGPLMLDSNAKTEAAHNFLDQVDAKLLEAAAANRDRADSVLSEETQRPKSVDEEMPNLKIKKSTNFGSAWGGDMPGRGF